MGATFSPSASAGLGAAVLVAVLEGPMSLAGVTQRGPGIQECRACRAGGSGAAEAGLGGQEGGSRVRGVWVTLQMPRGAAVCTASPSLGSLWWRWSPHGVPEGGG